MFSRAQNKQLKQQFEEAARKSANDAVRAASVPVGGGDEVDDGINDSAFPASPASSAVAPVVDNTTRFLAC